MSIYKRVLRIQFIYMHLPSKPDEPKKRERSVFFSFSITSPICHSLVVVLVSTEAAAAQ